MTMATVNLTSSPDIQASSLPSEAANASWSDRDLFRWHGAELIFMPVILLVGLVGNVCLFYIYHFRWKSTTVTLVKRMLAVLDMANLILAVPILIASTVEPHTPAFMATCVFSSMVALNTAIASSFVLVVIAVDRYMKLCQLKKRGISSVHSKMLFAASILASCVINIPSGWIFGKRHVYFRNYNVKAVCCFIPNEETGTTVFIVWAVLASLVFTSVTALLVFLYSGIVKTLKQLSAKHKALMRRPSLTGDAESIKRMKQGKVMRSTAIAFIAVTVCFFASYSPYFVVLLMSMLDPSIESSLGPVGKAFFDLAKMSPLINNVANPFIYSFTSETFRQEVKKMLTFRACKKGFFRRRAFSLSARSFEMSSELSQ